MVVTDEDTSPATNAPERGAETAYEGDRDDPQGIVAWLEQQPGSDPYLQDANLGVPAVVALEAYEFDRAHGNLRRQ